MSETGQRPGLGLTGFASGGALEQVPEPTEEEVRLLRRAAGLLGGRRIALLTGAGLSTDSGIPDYRGPDAPPRNPMTYQQFVGDADLRRRYWARNHVGWHHLRHAEPNPGHEAVAALERRGLLSGVITQNVDRLHSDAGSINIIDLHGRYDRVICLDCRTGFSREEVAHLLQDLNPGYLDRVREGGEIAPDADAEIADTDDFVVADCPVCGGMLKPDFVYFGENVPKDRVARAFAMVDAAGALLVAGSSLTVMSGLRFVRYAVKAGKPVVIINRGATRGDPLATLKIDMGVSTALTWLVRHLPDLPASAAEAAAGTPDSAD
ncbi:NAD-dependent protein deacetylase [Arthrobacter zhangbolii]|uniref:NAD-dependent protein deacetylase n=1 Tax=Arthrobacter zhangbolii TaxID=2886936 RepID=A0A9X1M6I2_9MICC|nr:MULTISPECIES: NAD-dependent protein deacetylase [Arthrobacter]MCC3271204.1 NAD-dependent protein deacetylase [Arthrobacter zhangbolii]MCC3293103.1 NAD-dependent protein deacetylase [Arthrobacter zhangbolii]MDN3904272.1 NAD-dependent protein deacetylase [Arthrobacter sp. YD2]UON91002.1 NAD-dependent protein deacetylase [Arthrobacter zhangbolii]